MKEAAGEANMTVIVIVLIGILAAFGALFIPRLLERMETRSCCTESGGVYHDGGCFADRNTTTNAVTLSSDCAPTKK